MGSQYLLEGVTATAQDLVLKDLKAHFRPEFLNRIDDIIMFHGLTAEDLKAIIEIQLQSVQKRLKSKELEFSISDAAKTKLAEIGYDPVFGARPLKRVIQRQVTDPISKAILEGKYPPGSTVKVNLTGEHIILDS